MRQQVVETLSCSPRARNRGEGCATPNLVMLKWIAYVSRDTTHLRERQHHGQHAFKSTVRRRGRHGFERSSWRRVDLMTTCESCQMHSLVRHGHELHPTYPPTVHFKWMMDLVTMPMRVGQMRYLVLAREDLTNQVEGRTMQNKTIAAVHWFLFEVVV